MRLAHWLSGWKTFTSRPSRRQVRRQHPMTQHYESRLLLSASPTGSEFQVNTATLLNQRSPSTAMDADGDFVVVWSSDGQDGSGNGIFGQRFDSDGIAQGAEFQINRTTFSNQRAASVAMDADGDFVVTWESYGQDGSGTGVYAQRYNAVGTPQGNELRVNVSTADNQSSTSVAMDASGNFVISWISENQDGSGSGIYAQRFNAIGVAQGSEFRVNTFTMGEQVEPAVSMNAAGEFVIAWHGSGSGGSGDDIYAQHFDAMGVAQGTEFQVNTVTIDQQRFAEVAMDIAGNFVVTWESHGQDGDDYGIYARRFSSTGVPEGAEFLVNSTTTGIQRSASIAIDVDGTSSSPGKALIRMVKAMASFLSNIALREPHKVLSSK